MKQSSASLVASNQPSLDKTRKRKRQNSTSTQQTLHSLLPGQQKPRLDAAPTALEKTVHAPEQPTAPTSTPRHQSVTSMYSFTSRTSTINGHSPIDLTQASPTTSPQVRRLSVADKTRAVSNPYAGAKKLVVKNLKTNNTWDSKAYLEKIWNQADEALSRIFKNEVDGFSKEDLYTGVQNVCRQGNASGLFSRLDARCRAHVESNIRDRLLQSSFANNVDALKTVLTHWTDWSKQMNTVRAIFFFLDRSYLLQSSKPTLDLYAPRLFQQIVFGNEQLKPRIVDGACDIVSQERSGGDQKADRELFRKAIDMLHALSTYTASFEPRYLATTQAYVSSWSSQTIQNVSLPEYVSLADQLIARELKRCEDFSLDASTQRQLLELLEDFLVKRNANALVDSKSIGKLLDENATAGLSALYSLLQRRSLGSNLRPAFEVWIDSTGTSIVFADDSDDMIVHLLSLKRRLDNIWKNAFQRDESLGHGLREVFEAFMNKTKKGDATWGTDNTKVGEMIAKYVDQLLRGGAKAIPDALSARRSSSVAVVKDEAAPVAAEEDNEDPDVDEDAEVNIQLDQVLDLFRFVHGKAIFEAFYKKDLARRLLMGRSASADAERSMLARLKTECGSNFTQNLEQMFKDVDLAREEMQSYKQRLEDRIGYEKGKNVDLSVNILSAAAWPTYPEIPVIIPANVKRAIDDFELHYKSKHTGRKLDWKHALAHCQMRATFGKGSKELVVSSFQAIVLLLFNGLADNEKLSYAHILSESGLPEQEVKRTLQSLACAKLRPLTKHPKGREINTTDHFSVDLSFNHPKYRVKINQVQLKETKEENKATHMRVAEDRNFECQAAIVRIMKSRKTIGHAELVSEVIKATISRGVLGVADIKKNIDRLIEKDYMEDEGGNMYSYVA